VITGRGRGEDEIKELVTDAGGELGEWEKLGEASYERG
jgi:hypothetical protein